MKLLKKQIHVQNHVKNRNSRGQQLVIYPTYKLKCELAQRSQLKIMVRVRKFILNKAAGGCRMCFLISQPSEPSQPGARVDALMLSQ